MLLNIPAILFIIILIICFIARFLLIKGILLLLLFVGSDSKAVNFKTV